MFLRYKRMCCYFRQSTCILSLSLTALCILILYLVLLEDSQKPENHFVTVYKEDVVNEKIEVLPGAPPVPPQVNRHNDNNNEGSVFKSNIDEYCNIPRSSESGDEGGNIEDYELKAVYTIIRHGDRTTLYSFPKTSNPSISCYIDQSQHPRLTDFINTMMINTGKQNVGSQFESWALYPNRQICDNSFLTPSGSLQHLLNGVHLNEKYVKKSNLFNGKLTADKLNIKVTEYSRTYQSAVALLYGFLPQFNLTELNIIQSRGVLFCSTQVVGSVCSCPAIQYYKGRGVQEVAQNIKGKKRKLKTVLKTIANVLNIETSQLPFNFAVFDILSSFVCHDIPLPCNEDNDCITKQHIDDLLDYLQEHAKVLHTSTSFRKHNSLSSYALLMDIAQHMIDVAHYKTNQVFSLYSGHDKTVSPILSVFGLNIGNSVKYAARLVFELYKHNDGKDHYFIKVLNHGKDVTAQVNFCQGRTRNGLCKIKYFLDFLKHDILKETSQIISSFFLYNFTSI